MTEKSKIAQSLNTVSKVEDMQRISNGISNSYLIEQHILDTNAGKQLS